MFTEIVKNTERKYKKNIAEPKEKYVEKIYDKHILITLSRVTDEQSCLVLGENVNTRVGRNQLCRFDFSSQN